MRLAAVETKYVVLQTAEKYELNIRDISVFRLSCPRCQFPSFRFFFVDGKTSNTVETERTAKWPEVLKKFVQKFMLGQQWSYAVFGEVMLVNR